MFGFMQADLKRVIAFHTCSQLGYMMVSVGLAEIGADAAMCHLMTHASFKAALFLAAGVVIVASGGNQHMARYGSDPSRGSFCFLALLVGSLSLVGWPELSGFYSKEAIIHLSVISFTPSADSAHTMLAIAALITATYSAKMLLQSFVLDFSGQLTPRITSPSMLITIAMTVLLADVLAKVWVGTNLISGLSFNLSWGTTTLPFGLVSTGMLTAMAWNARSRHSSIWLSRFAGTRWGFDQLNATLMVNMVMDWGRITWAIGDRGLMLMSAEHDLQVGRQEVTWGCNAHTTPRTLVLVWV
jgi:NADH-ubiquinone oxidoreductase chain 5